MRKDDRTVREQLIETAWILGMCALFFVLDLLYPGTMLWVLIIVGSVLLVGYFLVQGFRIAAGAGLLASLAILFGLGG